MEPERDLHLHSGRGEPAVRRDILARFPVCRGLPGAAVVRHTQAPAGSRGKRRFAVRFHPGRQAYAVIAAVRQGLHHRSGDRHSTHRGDRRGQ